MKTRGWILLFFSGLFLLLSFSPKYISVNHWSRFALTRSIVADHRFEIDPYIENNPDWSKRGEHYYSNKAPGTSFLAIPAYAAIRLAGGWVPKAWGDAWSPSLTTELSFSNVFATVLPAVLTSLLLLLYLLHHEKADPRTAWGVVLAYSLGTLAFPFSTMLWGHQTAAAFLFATFFFLVFNRPGWAGFFFGASVLSEYSCILAAPGLLFYQLFAHPPRGKDEWRQVILKLLRFAAGGLAPLAIFAFYHKACFGSPFSLAPAFGNPEFGYDESKRVFGVLSIPSPKILYQLLLGSKRGLFLLSPVLALALFGFPRWIASKYKAEAWLSLWIILVFWLFNASFNGWHGGWSSGPRYLIPMLPFLAIPLARLRPGKLFVLLTAISLINMSAITAVTTMALPEQYLLENQIYPNLFHNHRVGYFLAILISVALLSWIALKKAPASVKKPA